MPYLLDGNNLVGTARRRPGGSEDRDALVSEIAERLRRNRASVVLFFDGEGRPLSLGNLSVRFAGATSADDAIVREISRARRPAEMTVVTADRELVRRARDAGATAISPADFWRRFGAAVPDPVRPGETRVDVEDWERWFANERNKKE
ncbi:MAG TPA: NYN domain-containing protein [Thermoanaerobaculia bacterium]|nr:NYN domain-containing protein [Thermoanaerobaculia bacterium]